MKKYVLNSLGMLVIFTILLGLVYPLLTALAAQLLFPGQANGSLLRVGEKPVGSVLIGQNFTEPLYFHGRPSAAGADGYDATASAGSNLGPTNQVLLRQITERVATVRTENDLAPSVDVPGDLVTASGSGLDPHISVAAAQLQVDRVAEARGISADVVRGLVNKYTEARQFSFLGEPRVNVLRLNLALDHYQ